MLITMKKLLDVAKKEGGFAVPAPNVFSMETTEAAYQAAREMQAPVILNVWDAGAEWIEKQANLALYFEKKYPDVIAALNLDHGQSYDSEVAAIRSGFTSVMSDRSMMPLEQNVEQVKRIVDTAHAVNVSVEAELGHVGQGYEYEQTRDAWLTNPDEAVAYVEQTQCDCLAVAVGTSHGAYKGTPRLDFALLETLNSLVSVPLVLHGGSGTGDENLAKAVAVGIQKVNLCTDLMDAYERKAKEKAKTSGEFLEIYEAGVQGWKEELMRYMELFSAKGKAVLYQEHLSRAEGLYSHVKDENFTVQK